MPYDPKPLLDLRDKLLPPGGPAFNTGAFGGPEGLSPWGMTLWNFARSLVDSTPTKEQGQIGSPLGMLGGAGVVAGPGAWAFGRALPDRMSQFMQKVPEKFWVPSPQSVNIPGFAGQFSPSGNTKSLGNILLSESETNRVTPIHEALHALLYRKNQGAQLGALTETGGIEAAYPRNADKIAASMLYRDPSLYNKLSTYLDRGYSMKQALAEVAVEGMARNVGEKHLPPDPFIESLKAIMSSNKP